MTSSIKQRRAHKITEYASVDLSEKRVEITALRDPDLGTLSFLLHEGANVVAACDSAKRLSDWAFEEGARMVVHRYDLKLSDGEP